jgi:A/G-specific adenine glycosylase
VATVQGLRNETEGLRWVAAEEQVTLGLPAPIRKLLETGAPPAQPKRRTMRRAATSQDIE